MPPGLCLLGILTALSAGLSAGKLSALSVVLTKQLLKQYIDQNKPWTGQMMNTATYLSTCATQALNGLCNRGKQFSASITSCFGAFVGWVVKVCTPRSLSFFPESTDTAPGNTSIIQRTMAQIEFTTQMLGMLRSLNMSPADMADFLKLVNSDD